MTHPDSSQIYPFQKTFWEMQYFAAWNYRSFPVIRIQTGIAIIHQSSSLFIKIFSYSLILAYQVQSNLIKGIWTGQRLSPYAFSITFKQKDEWKQWSQTDLLVAIVFPQTLMSNLNYKNTLLGWISDFSNYKKKSTFPPSTQIWKMLRQVSEWFTL